jgi:LEA14-like dessication related protein
MIATRRLTTRTLLVAASVASLTLTACASLARQAFVTPVVTLKDVQVKAVGITGGAVDLVLEVNNQNDYRLDANRVTYTLVVDSATIATGQITKLVTLPAKQLSEVRLPVTISVKELLGAASIMARSGTVKYHVIGEVTVATPFGSVTRPYDSVGQFEPLRP